MTSKRVDFRPQTDGFAFANDWHYDSTEKQTAHDLIAGGGAAAAVILGPIILAVAGPAIVLAAGAVGPAILLLGPFAGLAIPPIAVAIAQAIIDAISNAVVSDDYGLCGGMAFASLDYYKMQWVVPRGNSPQDQPARTKPDGSYFPEGDTLRSYIWSRLVNSLQDNVVTVLTWMAALNTPGGGGPGWLLAKSVAEFTNLKGHIDSNEPWPIGLIGTTNNPTHNHQVLAYGYEDNGDQTGAIWVYDNNHPGEELRIGVDFRGSQLLATSLYEGNPDPESAEAKRGPLRGFFCEIYSFHVPPIAVGLVSGLALNPSECASSNEPVGFGFSVKNVGFHESPTIALQVAGSDGFVGGETMAISIPMGQSRELAPGVAATFTSPGAKMLVANCLVTDPNVFGAVYKVFPPIAAGADPIATLTVNPKPRIREVLQNCEVAGVAGRKAEFTIETSGFSDPLAVTFQWSVKGAAAAGPANQHHFSVQMPPGAGASVSLDCVMSNGHGCDALGTMSFQTVDSDLANAVQALCELSKIAVVNKWPVPHGDPISDRVVAPTELSGREFQSATVRLVQLVGRIVER
jgi:hypothetical protein